jgi:hypothetical protein
LTGAANGVVGVDPRVHAVAGRQLARGGCSFAPKTGAERNAARISGTLTGFRFTRDDAHPTFLGDVGTVTGSKHLLDINGHRILFDRAFQA